MAANTGRTVSRYTTVHLSDSGGTLRQLKVDSVGGVGLEFPEVDLTAWEDAVRGVLLDTPSFSTEIGGPFDTTTHGYLSGVNGLNTPLSFDVRVGIRQAYQAGEPQFGISKSATDGVLVRNYKLDPGSMKWSATIVMAAGSAAPAWGIAAEA